MTAREWWHVAYMRYYTKKKYIYIYIYAHIIIYTHTYPYIYIHNLHALSLYIYVHIVIAVCLNEQMPRSVMHVIKYKPAVLLVNGPGVCIPVCLGAVLLNLLGYRCAIVFVESICRVRKLSLSGRLQPHTNRQRSYAYRRLGGGVQLGNRFMSWHACERA